MLPQVEWAGSHPAGRGCTHTVKFSSRKQRLRSKPAQSCTPIMPKMKKTKKQSRRTFPSMGSVSRSRFTRIRIPRVGEGRQIVRQGAEAPERESRVREEGRGSGRNGWGCVIRSSLPLPAHSVATR